jgi:ATP-dependent Lon protease
LLIFLWDFQKRKPKIEVFFNELEELILKNTPLNEDQLGDIKKELKRFEEYIEVEKSTTIIHYILNVLKKIPYWSQSELKKNIRLIYNLKKK